MLKITADGVWETLSRVNRLIDSKEKQVNIVIEDFSAESFVGGKMDSVLSESTDIEVVRKHQRSGVSGLQLICFTDLSVDSV